MKIIKLPSLERIIYKNVGYKNTIKQLMVAEQLLPINIVSTDRSSAIIESNGNRYCFTCNPNCINDDFDYILLTNIKPTQERFENSNITIKRWLKHPLIKREYTAADVVESWRNDFYFIKENIEEGIYGLRTPQLGALHAILGHLQLPKDTATVVLPTGTGKTETMISTLVANRCSRLLVTVPSSSLRLQVSDKFYTFGLLKKFGIIGEKSLFPIYCWCVKIPV